MSDYTYKYDVDDYEITEEYPVYTDPYIEELPDSDEINELKLATAHMTDYEMIEFVTDLYVKKLSPLNYEAIEMEDMPCEKDVVFEKLYSE